MQDGEIRPWPKKNPTYWQLRYWTSELVKGKPVKKRKAVKLADICRKYQTEESVRALAQEKLLPHNLGTHQPESTDNLDTFLQAFLERGEGGRGKKLKSSTLGAYRDSYKLVQPHIRNMELRQVRVADIDRLLQNVAEQTDFAKTTYANLKNFLSSAFRSAARQGIINFNPVRDAAIPDGKQADTYAYTVEDVARMVLALVKHPNAKAAVIVAALTGLRKGEISGLRWEDYDRKNQELVISRSVYEGQVQTPKTVASATRVPVIRTVRRALAEHLKRNTGDGYIFHDSIGKPVRFENFTQREVQPILEEAGVPWHGLHAFRRFLGTVLNEKDVDLDTIKDVLRHSNNDVTKKSYIKPSTKRFRQMLEKVEKDLSRAMKELKE